MMSAWGQKIRQRYGAEIMAEGALARAVFGSADTEQIISSRAASPTPLHSTVQQFKHQRARLCRYASPEQTSDVLTTRH
jgi:hypothetical protein